MDAAPEAGIELFHGYTYSGCPVASAAAIATRDIFEQEQLVERAAKMSPKFLAALYSLKDLEIVTDIRGSGMLGGVDMKPLANPGGRGLKAIQALYEDGRLVKITGDCALVPQTLVAAVKPSAQICTKLPGGITQQKNKGT